MVPISSVRISRVLTYSGSRSLSLSFVYGDFTLFVLPFQVIRLLFLMLSRGPYPEYITTFGLGSSDFARHYFRNRSYFLFLRLLRCFTSPGSLRTTMDSLHDDRAPLCRVSPFGHLRINARLQLPAAFRSLPRPSSALGAKASSLCSL